MKRRLVLRETPIKTKKKGKVVTVQNVENILILNMYRDKDLTCRYCMNTDTGEYETWDAKTGEWSVMKAHRAAGGLDWYDNGRSVEKTLKYDPPESRALIKKALDGKTWRNWTEGLVLIDDVETDYGRDQREKKEERRMERERRLQERAPKPPEDFRDWALKAAGGGKHYLFWDKGKKQYACTACGGRSDAKNVPGKHNDMSVCPSCGVQAQVKRRTGKIMERGKVCLMQDMGADMSVCRHFDIRMEWTACGSCRCEGIKNTYARSGITAGAGMIRACALTKATQQIVGWGSVTCIHRAFENVLWIRNMRTGRESWSGWLPQGSARTITG